MPASPRARADDEVLTSVVVGSKINGSGLAAFAACPGLTELNLIQHEGSTDDGMRGVSASQATHQVDPPAQITDAGFAQLWPLENLEELWLKRRQDHRRRHRPRRKVAAIRN